MKKAKNTLETFFPMVRCTRSERQQVIEAAKAQNLSLSAYVRARLLPFPTPVFNTPIIASVTPLSPNPHDPLALSANPTPHTIDNEHDLPAPPPQTGSSQFENPSTPKALHGSAFINDTIARKVGHESGCTCTFCARMRTVLSTSKQDKPKAVRKR